MKLRKKTVIAVGALAFLVGAVAVAAAGNGKKKREEKPVEEEDDEVIVIPPGNEGIPDGSQPSIIVLPPKSESDFIPSSPPIEYSEPVKEDPRGPDYAAPLADVEKTPVSVPADTEAQAVQVVVQDILPPGTKVSPIALEEVKPTLDPNGTVMLARSLLSRENLPNWKEDMQSEVKAWQRKVGLKDDGLFGVVSAARMAEEVGILPLIRFWSKSYPSKAKALKDYEDKILKVAEGLQSSLPDSRPHILALGKSVEREKAKTFSAKPPANPTLEEVEKINQFLAAEAQSEGKKELAKNNA